jgi:hypothetical protein
MKSGRRFGDVDRSKSISGQMNYTSKPSVFQPLRPDQILSVVILPYVKFSRALRREILKARYYVSFIVAADEGVRDPQAFDQTTLRWAIQQASVVVVWAGSMPSELKRQQAVFECFREAVEPHCVLGGRVVYVNVELDDAGRWREHVRSLCRPETQISVIVSAPEAK